MPYFGGLYSGTQVIMLDCNSESDIQEVDDFLENMVKENLQDSIVSVSMLPADFCTNGLNVASHIFSVTRPTTYIDGHRVRNKKLFSYPYNFLVVDCCNDAKEFRYEWFYDSASGNPNSCSFVLAATTTPGMEISCIPYAYNSFAYRENNVTEELVMSGFPECPFTIDTYRAWIAQRNNILSGLKLAGTVITTAGIVAAAGLTGGAAAGAAAGTAATRAGITAASAVGGAIISGATQITKDVTDATKGSRVRGALGCSIDVAHRVKNFYFKGMSINRNYAEAIDDYFDRFGYACRRLKVPNRNVRPHWTYTQTRECTIRGAVPTDAMAKINAIYNKGITFWKNASEVGNYSLNNSPS